MCLQGLRVRQSLPGPKLNRFFIHLMTKLEPDFESNGPKNRVNQDTKSALQTHTSILGTFDVLKMVNMMITAI
jgi:hypothetical protein